MRRVTSTTQRERAGRTPLAFSLVEMLVVISIIAIVLAVTVPTLNAMSKGGRIEAGIGSIKVAVAAARAFATRSRAIPPNAPPLASNDGTAILFTTSNEMRLVENNMAALDTAGNPLEAAHPSGVELNGYSDISGREPVVLPKGVGVVGILRTNTGVVLLPPPFAIRFDSKGYLVACYPNDNYSPNFVYYDGDYDGRFDVTLGATGRRPNSYSPEAHDPEYGGGTYHAGEMRYEVPFERIEAVLGIIVFSKNDLRAQSLTLGDRITDLTTAGGVGKWLMDYGKPVYFSRYTGAVMREVQ